MSIGRTFKSPNHIQHKTIVLALSNISDHAKSLKEKEAQMGLARRSTRASYLQPKYQYLTTRKQTTLAGRTDDLPSPSACGREAPRTCSMVGLGRGNGIL